MKHKKFYSCPNLDCLEAIETRVPKKSEVTDKGFWDSAVTCPTCGWLHKKWVYPTGAVKVTLFAMPKKGSKKGELVIFEDSEMEIIAEATNLLKLGQPKQAAEKWDLLKKAM